MAGTPDISAILEQLSRTTQNPVPTTPAQGQPGLPAPSYPPAPAAGYAMPPSMGAPAPGTNFPPVAQYPYSMPAASGNMDLSAIKPIASGSVSIQDAIARAKQVATANNLTPYERPAVYGNNDTRSGDNRWRRSGSRSPSRRDNYRDSNSYDRRDERPSRDYGHHGRDRSYSPGPRGRQGGGDSFSPRGGNPARQRSPLRGAGGEEDVEYMSIEASLVGLIIGRQGENLKRVEGETKCRVQFLPAASPEEKYRQCKITGPRARRAEARSAINRIIEDSGMGAIARDRGGQRPPPVQAPIAAADRGGVANLKDGEECLQIMVPDRTVGLIIGRGGETIRDLQERSGCHVNIVGESKSVNGLRPVNLIGPYEAASKAKEMIMEIVESDNRSNNGPPPPGRNNNNQPREGGGPDKIQDTISVPSEAVGMIIGKGGETIREMQNTTGCKINVIQQPRSGETDREIELVGSRDSINRAKQAIEEKVEAVRQKNSGGGDRGGDRGGRGGRGHHRDYDNPNYGQPSNNTHQQQHSGSQGAAPGHMPAGGDAQADPYAAYGGYQNYLALWYQSLAAQQGAAAAAQGDASKPPGM